MIVLCDFSRSSRNLLERIIVPKSDQMYRELFSDVPLLSINYILPSGSLAFFKKLIASMFGKIFLSRLDY